MVLYCLFTVNTRKKKHRNNCRNALLVSKARKSLPFPNWFQSLIPRSRSLHQSGPRILYGLTVISGLYPYLFTLFSIIIVEGNELFCSFLSFFSFVSFFTFYNFTCLFFFAIFRVTPVRGGNSPTGRIGIIGKRVLLVLILHVPASVWRRIFGCSFPSYF